MRETGILIVYAVGLLVALEVLGAIYDAFRIGMLQDFNNRSRKREPLSGLALLLIPFLIIRFVVLAFMHYTRSVSLVIHELMHAIAQAALGGRPRIVLCRNGGDAQSRPWLRVGPLRLVYDLGATFGQGIMSLAPILGTSAILYAVLVVVTPIGPGAIEQLAAGLLADPGAASGRVLAHVLFDTLMLGSVLGIAGFVAASFIVAPSMTPSSTDYYHARYHVPVYAAAVIIAVHVFGRPVVATWIMLAAGLVVGIPFGAYKTPLGNWGRSLLGGLGLSCAILAGANLAGLLGDDPAHGLQLGLSGLVVLLVMAAMIYAAFIAVFLAATLLTFRPGALWQVAKHIPREILSVVQKFDTCTSCNLHFRKTCDGCGRSARDIAAAQRRT